jgi:hypothetical protein
MLISATNRSTFWSFAKCRQLHHPLTVFRALSNRPLDKIAISFLLPAQPLKFIDEAVNFAYRELSHPAKQCASIDSRAVTPISPSLRRRLLRAGRRRRLWSRARHYSPCRSEAWAHRCNNAEAAGYWRRCQSEWAARARRSLKFCEMQLHLVASA